jgi:hypothetical protein
MVPHRSRTIRLQAALLESVRRSPARREGAFNAQLSITIKGDTGCVRLRSRPVAIHLGAFSAASTEETRRALGNEFKSFSSLSESLACSRRPNGEVS